MDVYVAEYNIRQLMREQLDALLKAQPEDPLDFIMNWAQKERSRNNSFSTTPPQGQASNSFKDPHDMQPNQAVVQANAAAAIAAVKAAVSSRKTVKRDSVTSIKSIDEAVTEALSPYASERHGVAPFLNRGCTLSMPDITALSKLESPGDTPRDGEATAPGGMSIISNEEELDINELGPSCISPVPVVKGQMNYKPPATTEAAAAAEAASNSVATCQCDAAAPLPIRVPNSLQCSKSLQDMYKEAKRVSSFRINAVRISDNTPVSMYVLVLAPFTKTDVDDLLREVYSIISVSARHKNVLHTVDCFIERTDEGTSIMYLVQERIENPLSLKDYVAKHGKLSALQSTKVMMELVHTIHLLHYQQQPHLQIQADNMFVTLTATDLEVKLGTFKLIPTTKSRDDDFDEDLRALAQVIKSITEHYTSSAIVYRTVEAILAPHSTMTTTTVLAALSQSTPEYVLEHSGIPIIVTSRRGVIESWNVPATHLFGFSREEAMGKNITLIMPPEMAEIHPQLMLKHEKKNLFAIPNNVIDKSRIVCCKTKAGKLIQTELRISETSQTQFTAIFRDVSPLRSLMVHHKIKTYMNAAICDYIPVGVVGITKHGIIKEFNREAAELFSYLPGHIIGSNVSILMPPEIGRHHDEFLVRYQRTKQSNIQGRNFHTVAKTSSGQQISVRLVVYPTHPVDDLDDEEIAFTGYFTSLSGFTNDFDYLFHSIADGLLTATVLINEYGLIQRFSRFAEELFEYKESEVINQNVSVLMDDEMASRHQQFIERYKRFGIANILGKTVVHRAKKKNGSLFPCCVCAHPFYRGNTLYFIGFVYETSLSLPTPPLSAQPAPVSYQTTPEADLSLPRRLSNFRLGEPLSLEPANEVKERDKSPVSPLLVRRNSNLGRYLGSPLDSPSTSAGQSPQPAALPPRPKK